MNKEFDAEIGARVRALRTSSGLSQTDLGMRVGASAQQIHKYEHGVNQMSLSRMVDIATALGTTVAWFLEEGTTKASNSDRMTLEVSRSFSAIHSDRVRTAASELLRAISLEGRV